MYIVKAFSFNAGSIMMRSIQIMIALAFLLPSVVADGVYRSLTALDQYGSSPQINNARLASKLHSMPTIVTSSGCSLITITLEKKRPGAVPRNKCNIIGESEECKLATIGSGLSGDAAFLNRLLRRDVMHTWERYDAIPDCSRVAHTASRIMLAFMGYEDDVRDGSMDVLMDDNGDRLSIGRPLAVNLIIARLDMDGFVEIRLVEPSGVVSDEILGRVLGRGCQKGTELLRQRWRDDMDVEKTEEVCIGIMIEITLSEYLVGDHGGEDDYCIVVEVLDCKNGLTIKRIPFAKEQKR